MIDTTLIAELRAPDGTLLASHTCSTPADLVDRLDALWPHLPDPIAEGTRLHLGDAVRLTRVRDEWHLACRGRAAGAWLPWLVVGIADSLPPVLLAAFDLVDLRALLRDRFEYEMSQLDADTDEGAA